MENDNKAGIPVSGGENEEFENSVKSFSASADMTPEAKKRRKRKKLVNAFIFSFLGVCAAVLAVCVFLIGRNLSDKARGEEVYNDASMIFDPVSLLDADKTNTSGDEPPLSLYEKLKKIYDEGQSSGDAASIDLSNIRASLSQLKMKNDDVVGWIYIEGTKISYPLMRCSWGDDDYYLNHAWNGEYLAVGSIYMVSSCDVKLDNNYNTLIYGHNVVNGAMFHDVMKFLDPEFFTTKIMIYTLDGVYVYQPFSIYGTKSDYNYIQTDFASEYEFLTFAEEMKANSAIASDLSIGEGDTMITLSTCTGTGVVSNDRYSLHAKLVDFIG